MVPIAGPDLPGVDAPGGVAAGAWPDPVRRKASHVTADSDEFIELCARALDSDVLHHVAEYHRGVFNYSVDILDQPSVAGHMDDDGGTTDDRRTVYTRMGRQLNFLIGRVDQSLMTVDSGQLIRTVLEFGEGVLYHYLIRPGNYLIGVTLGGGDSEPGDRAMAALTGELRSRLRQGPFDAGGFKAAAGLADPSWTGSPEPDGAPALVPHTRTAEEEEAGTANGLASALELCAGAVRRSDLHYAAYYDPAHGSVSADLLAHPELNLYHRDITREERRDRYETNGRRFHYVVARLNHSLGAVVRGWLKRAVFDVEEGAIYYYALDGGRFLIGVTLYQNRVLEADEHAEELAGRLDALAGL